MEEVCQLLLSNSGNIIRDLAGIAPESSRTKACSRCLADGSLCSVTMPWILLRNRSRPNPILIAKHDPAGKSR